MAFCHISCPPCFSTSSAHIQKRPNDLTHRLIRSPPRRKACSAHPSMVMTDLVPAFVVMNVGQAVTVNMILFALARAVKQRVLTDTGLLHALFLGVLLWTCLSWEGYLLCFSFLILGSVATRVGKARKEALGIAEKRGGARGPENLWGAAGVAAICAVGALFCSLLYQGGSSMSVGWYNLFLLGYTGSIATKMADTLSSEIGKAYGSTTYLITTFQVVPKGTEGAVSLEGTLAGIAASLMAGYYAFAVNLIHTWMDLGIVVVAAFIATTLESIIGASVQEKYNWSNELVNFMNTAIGAIAAMLLGSFFLFGST